MNILHQIELANVDRTLTELSKQKREAPKRDRPFIMARIDLWLDRRLALMK